MLVWSRRNLPGRASKSVQIGAALAGALLLVASGCRSEANSLCAATCDAGPTRGRTSDVDALDGTTVNAGDDGAHVADTAGFDDADTDALDSAASLDTGIDVSADDGDDGSVDGDALAVAGEMDVAADLAVDNGDGTDAAAWQRDWTLHPAVFLQKGSSRLWGLSDVHGDRSRLMVLLGAAGLVSSNITPPAWTGGTDTLVVSGDSIDKGAQSIEVLDYWMALIPQAKAAGGNLVVMLGNHEAEFLADPNNTKAAALVAELGSEMPSDFASSNDPHGRFLREMPIAALVDGWFFSHAGNAGGQSADQIAGAFQRFADADAWSDSFFLDPNSILEARHWWPTGAETNGFLDGYLAALPAHHFVFGHHPTTFADPPSGNIEVHAAGRLFLIDVGMSIAVNYSTGKLLKIDSPGTAQELVGMIDPTGDLAGLDLTSP